MMFLISKKYNDFAKTDLWYFFFGKYISADKSLFRVIKRVILKSMGVE